VRKDIFDEYNELLDDTSQQTVWTHPGTNTYFRNSRGRLVFVSPFRNVEYWTRARQSSIRGLRSARGRAARVRRRRVALITAAARPPAREIAARKV